MAYVWKPLSVEYEPVSLYIAIFIFQNYPFLSRDCDSSPASHKSKLRNGILIKTVVNLVVGLPAADSIDTIF